MSTGQRQPAEPGSVRPPGGGQPGSQGQRRREEGGLARQGTGRETACTARSGSRATAAGQKL